MTPPSPGLALIGTGYWGKNLARNFDALGALVALCDADALRLADFQKQYPHVHCEADWQVLLADPQIRQVAIATPPETHAELVAEALRAGKDVFVEKPICHGFDECLRLVELAEAQQRVLMVGHLLQYHPFIRRLQGLIGEGTVGRPRYVESRRCNIGKIYTERNVLWNFGPHDVTLVLAMHPGSRVREVSCRGTACLSPDCEDAVVVNLGFEDGASGLIQLSWISPVKEQRLLVYGEAASVVFDDTLPWDEKLTLYPGWTGSTDGRQGREGLAAPEPQAVENREPLREECAHFVQCCQQRIQPATGGTQALAVQAVLDAAQKSLDAGGAPQPVPRR